METTVYRKCGTGHCYYNTPPEKKSLEDCVSHGSDHASYKWPSQIDPRWSDEQKKAYRIAYETYKF